MSSENYKIPRFPAYRPNIPAFQPPNLSITNQTWTPNQTTFKSLNFASQSFLNFPSHSSNITCEIKSPSTSTKFGNEIVFKSKVSLVISSSNLGLNLPPPPLFANGTLTADSFAKRKLEKSYHVTPDFPRYTATEKLFFNAFDSFSRWTNQQPPTSLNLPGTQELIPRQSQAGIPIFNAPMISFKADCWVQVKNGIDLNNRPTTSLDIKVTSVTINFFDPMKVPVAGLTSTEKNRIAERTRQYEISAKESKDRYMARKLSGDAERPLSQFVRITGKMAPDNSLKTDMLPKTGLDQVMQVFKEKYALRTDENRTRTFTTAGISLPNLGIGGINGMLTEPSGGFSHASYVTELAGGISINWTYNHTNGPLDIVEVFAMNYLGFSPNTARELGNVWTRFHEKHLDNPNVKYLQLCHSQGAIHTLNALINLPKEIRDRVIVVAIAPAVLIPKALCFDSSNYACKGDPVPLGKMISVGLFTSMESASPQLEELLLRRQNELILLDAIPGNGSRHDLQNEAFKPFIRQHLEEYVGRNGIY